MRKLLIVFTIFSLIGCTKESLEPETVYLDHTPAYLGDYYFQGSLGGEDIVISDINQVYTSITPHPTNLEYIYSEKLSNGVCHGDGLAINFLKSFSDSVMNCQENLSVYELGDLSFGNTTTGKNGIVITYSDYEGEDWYSELGSQNQNLSIIYSIGLNYDQVYSRKVTILLNCNLYNDEGDVKVLIGEFISSAVAFCR